MGAVPFDGQTLAAALSPAGYELGRKVGPWPFRKEATVAARSWEGVVAAFGLNDLGETVTGNRGTLANSAALGEFGTPGRGLTLNLGGDTNDIMSCETNASVISGTQNVSVMVWATGGGTGRRNLLIDSNDNIDIRWRHNNGPCWIVDTSAGFIVIDIAAEDLPSGGNTFTSHCLLGTYNAGVGILYLDGRSIGTASVTAGATIDTIDPTIELGGVAGVNDFIGCIHRAVIWNRTLGAAEAKALSRDPEAMWRPDLRRIAWPKAPAAGGGIAPAVALYHARHHNRAA